MLLYDEDETKIGLMFAFWAPLMYLVYPEVRDSKFHEHALPGVYYGPSRATESDRYCSVWNGHRTITVDIGSVRIDETQILARHSIRDANCYNGVGFFTVLFPDLHYSESVCFTPVASKTQSDRGRRGRGGGPRADHEYAGADSASLH